MSAPTQPSITEFLLVRIAEDEAVARNAIDPDRPGVHWQWVRQDDEVVEYPTSDDMPLYLGTIEEYPTSFGDRGLPAFALDFVEADDARALPHIARHDPARVLADCEAKRRIVDHHQGAEPDKPELPDHDQQCLGCADIAPCPTLRYLALPYADHPDYDEAWRL